MQRALLTSPYTKPGVLSPGVPSLEAMLWSYSAKSGFGCEDFGVYRTYTLFKVACILQGIAARVRRGTSVAAPVPAGMVRLARARM
jgi:aminoglycoside phosphotransferase (APT) family kinase protein